MSEIMPQRPQKLVGISGPSCSGKTTLERNLLKEFGDEIALFPFDDMFIGRDAVGDNVTSWESPDLYRWNDFAGHLRDLKSGRPTTVTAKSRESKLEGVAHRIIVPRRFTTVVGFLALYPPEIREQYNTTIYLHIPEEVILERRRARADPDKPWDTPEYIENVLITEQRRVMGRQLYGAEHMVSGTLPPEEVAARVAAIIRR